MSTLEYALGINEFKEENLLSVHVIWKDVKKKQATQQKMKE